MSRESFEDRLNREPEPYPGEVLDHLPEEIEKEPDTIPEEELLNEEENKEQEDEVEEVFQEKPGKKEKAPISEEKLDDTEINKRIIEAQSIINKIEAQLEIETDEKKRLLLNEFLEKTKSERDRLLNYREIKQ